VEEAGVQTARRAPIANGRATCQNQQSKARRIGPALSDLSEKVVDRVQAEQAGGNQIERHGDADDAGRDQQKHARGQGDEWQEGAGCIGMHPASIADSMALG
jgi:hypothetical protein